MNASIQRRLRFIDFVLDHFGKLNRRELMDYFGISEQQASLDIREYKKLYPKNIGYELSRKTYYRTDNFVRELP